MPKRKFDLAQEAEKLPGVAPKVTPITEAELLERCPKAYLAAFKKTKSPGDRADFLKKLDDDRKAAQSIVNEMEEFGSGLKRWFIENLPHLSATGVVGKTVRVQIVEKEKVDVLDWPKFYAWVRKNNAFEFFERKVKLSSAQDRWKGGKKIPGIERGSYKSISITKK